MVLPMRRRSRDLEGDEREAGEEQELRFHAATPHCSVSSVDLDYICCSLAAEVEMKFLSWEIAVDVIADEWIAAVSLRQNGHIGLSLSGAKNNNIIPYSIRRRK
jgi:hypothetical protein